MKTLLKQLIKKLWNWIIIWIWIILSIWIFFIVYATTFTSLTPVWSGSGLTSSAWNLMVSNLDDLNWRLNTLNTTVSGLSATPSWAVMAFNLASCPTGWTTLASAAWRVIVGKNTSDTSFDVLGETWWAKTHTLTTAEMPSHSHGIPSHNWGGWLTTINNNRGSSSSTNNGYGENTNVTGGWWAHNNLQPYLTLLYCQKD